MNARTILLVLLLASSASAEPVHQRFVSVVQLSADTASRPVG